MSGALSTCTNSFIVPFRTGTSASASGRFDDEQLFYLQARGISENEARKLVVFGFLNEIIQQIGIESVETRLAESIETELARSTH